MAQSHGWRKPAKVPHSTVHQTFMILFVLHVLPSVRTELCGGVNFDQPSRICYGPYNPNPFPTVPTIWPTLRFSGTNATLHLQTDAESKENVSDQYSSRDLGSTRKNGNSFLIHTTDCHQDKIIDFVGMQGELRGVLRETNSTKLECKWKIAVPENRYMFVRFEMTEPVCPGLSVIIKDTFVLYSREINGMDCFMLKPSTYIPLSNFLYFELNVSLTHSLPQFKVTFSATVERQLDKMNVETLSGIGVITPPGYDGRSLYAGRINAYLSVKIPEHHTLMISFENFQLDTLCLRPYYFCNDYLRLLYLYQEGSGRVIWKRCGHRYLPPELYDHSITLHFLTNIYCSAIGFKLRFSLHPATNVPQQLNTGLFNCTSPSYISFKEHIYCNMHVDCEGREDEGGHCPFSNVECDGAVAVHNKCYSLVWRTDINWTSATQLCQSRRSTLATIHTTQEWEAVSQLAMHGTTQWTLVLVGLLTSDKTMPHYYRYATKWVDNTINYSTHVSSAERLVNEKVCTMFIPGDRVGYLRPLPGCSIQRQITGFAVCQSSHRLYEQRTSVKLSLNIIHVPKSLLLCPSGHMTLPFMACHQKGLCTTVGSSSVCELFSPTQHKPHTSISHAITGVKMFTCANETEQIPYTLVCDFVPDCADKADEDFCIHDRQCSGFTCKSGQCITRIRFCDTYPDCVDGSDENDCWKSHVLFPTRDIIDPPAVIHFSSHGSVTMSLLNGSDPCPQTHFRCPGKVNYCLPAYVMCNGVYDCVGQEDESGCDSVELCPGFYRCWDSSVCLHLDHVCDGWAQCPRRDDELLCNFSCPPTCQCQGWAFVCRQTFPATHFQNIRYLDASGFGIHLRDLGEQLYLIFAKLTFCHISTLSELHFPNLQTLDLADNRLEEVKMKVFTFLHNLKFLRLSRNPIVTLVSGNYTARAISVERLDLSQTKLAMFDSSELKKLPYLKHLNISYSHLNVLSEHGFNPLIKLSSLDLTGNPVGEFHDGIFKELTELSVILTSNFRICCSSNLPDNFDGSSMCVSPRDEISTCEDLLRSNTYRVFLWSICGMSVLGNAGSLIFRNLHSSQGSRADFNIFVSSLCLSDLMMGIYLAIIGSGDILYRGRYVMAERIWTTSVVCKTAGMFSLMSSEVSAFIICIITLDRFIVLRFPFSTLRFCSKSALAVCCFVWTAGLLLASVPLFPITSSWAFYSQTGICIPLPITRKQFQGQMYSFGIIIVLNFILFLFIAAGQVIIYFSIKANIMMTDTTKKSQDVIIARRLITVVLSDFVCWFPIGLLGLLASAGVAISSELNVAMAIFVLPLNSALNPFLYTLNVLMETQKKERRLKLLQFLHSQPVLNAENEQSIVPTVISEMNLPACSVDEVLQFLVQGVKSGLITVEKVVSSIEAMKDNAG